MSWGASYQLIPGRGEVNEVGTGIDSDEAKLAYKAARLAAAEVTLTGALGGPTHAYNVVLSGHSNPNNEPVAGWANDFVQITITQVDNKE